MDRRRGGRGPLRDAVAGRDAERDRGGHEPRHDRGERTARPRFDQRLGGSPGKRSTGSRHRRGQNRRQRVASGGNHGDLHGDGHERGAQSGNRRRRHGRLARRAHPGVGHRVAGQLHGAGVDRRRPDRRHAGDAHHRGQRRCAGRTRQPGPEDTADRGRPQPDERQRQCVAQRGGLGESEDPQDPDTDTRRRSARR